ncbi:Ras of Complex, Roc, domain of DAPkinase [Plasmodiophora brassicae]|uniref:Uncharacterized protein n=1 Tax=Plasmodiophora brassicae TaxID=37360 RepID=A0A0G4IQM7_PLABS|nr:hypothetical protein PBRA_000786 [Plasmodiophora brassicae]SPQ97753.1 unnamed protein product [Plasmodiophora brassicae]
MLSDGSLKMLLVGDNGVGKTALFHRLITNTFSRAYQPSDRVSIGCQMLKTGDFIELWDVPPHQILDHSPACLCDADAVCIVANDAADDDHLRSIPAWTQILDHCLSQAGHKRPLTFVLVNKVAEHDSGAPTVPPDGVVGIFIIDIARDLNVSQAVLAMVEAVKRRGATEDA